MYRPRSIVTLSLNRPLMLAAGAATVPVPCRCHDVRPAVTPSNSGRAERSTSRKGQKGKRDKGDRSPSPLLLFPFPLCLPRRRITVDG
jgi:hypothetical protein